MIEKNKETNKYHAVCDCCYEYGSFKQGVKEMSVTLEEKIKQLRAAEKRLRKHLSEDEFGVVRRTAEGFGQEADLLEELKRYRDLEEQGRLLALPCGVGKYEKRLVDLDKAMDESTLCDWYITSVSLKDEPVWTDRHIEELLNDFYVIPKD